MSNPNRRWGAGEIVTAAVVGVAALLGGLLGAGSGAAQAHSTLERWVVAFLLGVGGTVIWGFIALLVCAIASAAWTLVVSITRKLTGHGAPDQTP
jgi:hypothetical protein